MNRATLTADRLVELGYAFRGAKALMSAVELGVFTALAEAPLDSNDLRRRLAVAERGARDFFDALVALGLLQRDEYGRYSNAPDADLYLDSRKATYIGGFLENLEAREYGLWGSLTAALRTGEPQTGFEERAHFGALYSDPKRLDFFVRSMTGTSQAAVQAMAERFPWADYATVVDVGTAQGCLPVQIALSHSHVGGGGFDLPILRTTFDAYVECKGLSGRLRFYPGTSTPTPCPTPTCSSWAGFCTIGISRRSGRF